MHNSVGILGAIGVCMIGLKTQAGCLAAADKKPGGVSGGAGRFIEPGTGRAASGGRELIMIEIIQAKGPYKIVFRALPMGGEWCVAITGGREHLGAVAIGIPRPSLSGSGRMSASVSSFTVTGHMDDEISRAAALFLAKNFNCSVAVSCGIHFDHISVDGIETVKELVQTVMEEFLG
jgi:hypothetical protein